MKKLCEDCGLELLGKVCEGDTQPTYNTEEDLLGSAPGHPNMCCDCFDQLFGMDNHLRTRLRPDSTPEDHAKHATYWQWIAEKKARKKKPN
jgi:hypothetical protein